jgi:SAM-dependent methyltransferase
MDRVRELLACPACGGTLAAEAPAARPGPGAIEKLSCAACGAAFAAPDGIPDLRLRADDRTEALREFYAQAPFPGCPPHDTFHALRTRGDRSAFARLLDRSIAANATIAEIGCGTGQMCLYLARADRVIIGADLTRASLALGSAAAHRFGIDSVQFVETDLRHPGLKAGAFDVVFSSGVVHHTPQPRVSFARIAGLARPGGIIVLGVYNRIARIPLKLRRLVARASGFRIVPFDPVLRDRKQELGRREAWLRDQYRHPEERCHSVAEVQRWFAENDVEYLRTYPSAVLGDEPDDLFAPAADNWRLEGWLAQLEWMFTLGREGGLFYTIGRRAQATLNGANFADSAD